MDVKDAGKTSSSTSFVGRSLTRRRFRILLVVVLVIVAVQGWSGDSVNIFFAPTSGITPPPFYEFFAAVESIGPLPVFHAVEGILLSILSIAVFALSFIWSKSRGVRIASGLGLVMILSASIGGFMFVMSGFSDGGASSQMGASFIGGFAFYFISVILLEVVRKRGTQSFAGSGLTRGMN